MLRPHFAYLEQASEGVLLTDELDDMLAHAHTRQFRDKFIRYMKQNYLGDTDLVSLEPVARPEKCT